ncbi:MAG TPA: glycosyltransferase family 9 protein [Terrimicrobiaceae bacterium]
MKITISSPDGLGDFVLRMPLFEALRDAGHDLQIFMRPPAFELAVAVLPRARIEKIREDPYARLVRFRRNPFAFELRKIAAFAPDLFVVALFQHSSFDEICLSKLPKRLRVAGFRSADSFWGTLANTAPQELAERFDMWVEVKTGIAELEKNRLLASAILGSPVRRRPARIAPPQRAIGDARSFLREHNIDEGQYWVVCAGSRRGLEVKDWGEANWIAALSQIVSEAKAPFLFLGNEAEAASIERIRSRLPEDSRHFNLASSPPSLLQAFGIIALSAGFVGRDSGPMQLAAASQRPILAIFGGSHWGRFFPEGSGAVIVSREVPCQGCLGYCHLPEPFCVRRVTVQQFLDGWKVLRDTPPHETRIVEIPMDADLSREIAETGHLRFPELAHEARRQIFETGRAVSLLDSAGFHMRLLARQNYRQRFSR